VAEVAVVEAEVEEVEAAAVVVAVAEVAEVEAAVGPRRSR
jgi:hypothetical protein